MSETAIQLLELFDWSDGDDRHITWFDKTGVTQLDDDRRAVVTLTNLTPNSAPYSGHYQSFKVEIVSKTRGPIASKVFYFDEYLSHLSRIDDRQRGSAHPFDHQGHFYLWNEYGKGVLRWYIAVPETTEPLTSAILEYIDTWR